MSVSAAQWEQVEQSLPFLAWRPAEDRPLLRRTADLGARALERSARLSRREAARRARVLRNKAYFIVQCALAAATSYALAKYLFRVAIPLFAPVAAMVCLGMTHGQRLRRALEITVGVAVGVFFGEEELAKGMSQHVLRRFVPEETAGAAHH